MFALSWKKPVLTFFFTFQQLLPLVWAESKACRPVCRIRGTASLRYSRWTWLSEKILILKQSLNLIIGKGEKFWRPTYFSSFEFVHTGSKTKFSQQVPKRWKNQNPEKHLVQGETVWRIHLCSDWERGLGEIELSDSENPRKFDKSYIWSHPVNLHKVQDQIKRIEYWDRKIWGSLIPFLLLPIEPRLVVIFSCKIVIIRTISHRILFFLWLRSALLISHRSVFL